MQATSDHAGATQERLEFEQVAAELENQVYSLSAELQNEKKARLDWETRCSGQKKEIDDLRTALSNQKKEWEAKVKHAETNSKKVRGCGFIHQAAQSDQEKQSLVASILNKDQEIARLTDDVAQASVQVLELRQELRVEKERFTDVQANELALKTTLASSQYEVVQANKMIEWLNQELETKSAQLQDYRKEKVDQVKHLQSDLESTVQEKNSLELRGQMLQKRVDELEVKLASKMDQLRDTENRHLVAEQQFKNEMTSQKKLTDLYIHKSQEFSTHNEELEELVRDLESKLEQITEAQQQRQAAYEAQLSEHQKIQEGQELELEQLRSQLRIINSDLIQGNQADQIAQLSQTAAAASRLSRTGKSFTEIYSDYTKLQQELIKERSEVARLNECLNHIVAEFEQRAPLIQKTNEDNLKARDQIESLSIQLSNAVREKNEALSQVQSMKSTCQALEMEQKLLQKDIEDRGRQLQAVLREQEILKGAHPSSLDQDEYDTSLSGADAIISRRLVVFKNIEELQTQNQALLRSIRSLSAKMEAQEKLTFEQADQARIDALTESTKIIER
ncbi:hypothetical protein HDU91_001608, partial [Kappamyces sp. JEL0680]